MARPPMPAAQRTVAFWTKVDFSRGADGCWLWLGNRTKQDYGVVAIKGKPTAAHRIAYRICVGEIPTGYDIDHLCREPACVNPAHLEAVTRGTNVLRGHGLSAENARKTHCHRGHEFTPENTYVRDRMRTCKACRRQRDRARRS